MLNQQDEQKINSLVAKACKPPTFTAEELEMAISLSQIDSTLVSTQQYIASFADQRQASIMQVQALSPSEAAKLVIARLKGLPTEYTAGFGRLGTLSKEAIVQEVQKETNLGKEILHSEIFNLVVLQRLIAKFETMRLE